jgi:hypothetical protein
MRPYIKARRHERRAKLIEMLGGRCVRCGATEKLHFDHIDPSTKTFAVGSDLSRAWDVLVEEALKTQLLCPPCHVEKGREDRPEVGHGLYRYEYYRCRCDVCKAANSIASARKRELYPKRKKSRAKSPAPGTLIEASRSGVAQLAEQPAVNRFVVGSSPTAGAKAGSKTGAGARRSKAPSPSPAKIASKRPADTDSAG